MSEEKEPEEAAKQGDLPEKREDLKGSDASTVQGFLAFAEVHVQTSKEIFGQELNYDEHSLKVIDALTKFNPGEVPDNLDTILLTVGSYLGETLIKILGGFWEKGEEGWHVNIQGQKINPFFQVRDRFVDPENNTTWDWYQGIRKDLGLDVEEQED